VEKKRRSEKSELEQDGLGRQVKSSFMNTSLFQKTIFSIFTLVFKNILRQKLVFINRQVGLLAES
jgi:hypothetical protein